MELWYRASRLVLRRFRQIILNSTIFVLRRYKLISVLKFEAGRHFITLLNRKKVFLRTGFGLVYVEMVIWALRRLLRPLRSPPIIIIITIIIQILFIQIAPRSFIQFVFRLTNLIQVVLLHLLLLQLVKFHLHVLVQGSVRGRHGCSGAFAEVYQVKFLAEFGFVEYVL